MSNSTSGYKDVYWSIVGIREKLETTRMFKFREMDG